LQNERPLVELPPGRHFELRIKMRLRWRSFTQRESTMRASRIENALSKLTSYLARRWQIEMVYDVTEPVEITKAKAE
jgi:hypothetical protein